MRIAKRIFLSLILLAPFAAQAAEKPDVNAALTAWVVAVEAKDPAKVVALYDDNAIFFSTFAVKPLKTQAERLGYYTKALAEPDIKIDILESHPHVFGEVAINSGLYDFHYTQDGEPVTIHSRFSFTYQLQSGKWMIIDHHSSKKPGTGE